MDGNCFLLVLIVAAVCYAAGYFDCRRSRP